MVTSTYSINITPFLRSVEIYTKTSQLSPNVQKECDRRRTMYKSRRKYARDSSQARKDTLTTMTDLVARKLHASRTSSVPQDHMEYQAPPRRSILRSVYRHEEMVRGINPGVPCGERIHTQAT